MAALEAGLEGCSERLVAMVRFWFSNDKCEGDGGDGPECAAPRDSVAGAGEGETGWIEVLPGSRSTGSSRRCTIREVADRPVRRRGSVS